MLVELAEFEPMHVSMKRCFYPMHVGWKFRDESTKWKKVKFLETFSKCLENRQKSMNFADVSEENLEFFRHIEKFGKFCRSEENLEIFRHIEKFGNISPTH